MKTILHESQLNYINNNVLTSFGVGTTVDDVFRFLYGEEPCNFSLSNTVKWAAIKRAVKDVKANRQIDKIKNLSPLVNSLTEKNKRYLWHVTKQRIKREFSSRKSEHDKLADILATSYSLPISKAASTPEGIATLAGLPSEKFYQTPEWKKLRLEAFALYGRKCQVCGDSPENGCILEVDHITPRYMQPHIAFDIKNLRVLCRVCHQGRTYRHNDHASTSMDGLRGRK